MTLWLYQMNATKWPVERYRAEVWEGTDIQNWSVGEIRASTSGKLPKPGDMMILFYVKTRQADPGIYGWGVVLRCDEWEMNFRLATPSDYLKMNPVWDKDVDNIITKFCGKWRQATLFEDKSKSLEDLRQKIAQHVYGGVAKTEA
jgi:hypothetical protein